MYVIGTKCDMERTWCMEIVMGRSMSAPNGLRQNERLHRLNPGALSSSFSVAILFSLAQD
jgi:hypothetical protein